MESFEPAQAPTVQSSQQQQHPYNHLTPKMQHILEESKNHQKMFVNHHYQKIITATDKQNQLKNSNKSQSASASSSSENYKSNLDIIENMLSQNSTPPPASYFPQLQTNTQDTVATSSKPISSSKSSFDHDNKENMATNAQHQVVESNDSNDFIPPPPPPPTKKSKSSIKITKLNKAPAEHEAASTQVCAKENEAPMVVETQPAAEHAARSSKRKLPSAKSVDYKEVQSPERQVKQRPSSRKENAEATKNKKRKVEEEEEDEDEVAIDGKVIKEAVVLNLYADDDEERKSSKNDNDEADANVDLEAMKLTKRITRQKNAKNCKLSN